MESWVYAVQMLGSVLNTGLLLAAALVTFLVAMSAQTRDHRPAAWLLFGTTTGVFVMNAGLLAVGLGAPVLVGTLGVDGYKNLVAGLLVVEWPITVLIGVALLRFHTSSRGGTRPERHG